VTRISPDPIAFIRANTVLKSTSLVPEVQLHLADGALELWQLTEDELEAKGLPPPFWAFAWAGGQALARYLLDTPDLVRGKTVFDFASGSGLVAIACALAGAERVVANEIDAFALRAIRLNAEANDVSDRIVLLDHDVLSDPPEGTYDLIVAGDVCYEKPMADLAIPFLQARAATGVQVLIGDPGRTYLPKSGLEQMAEYRVPVPLDLEDTDLRRTVVWRVGSETVTSVS
jgi:predicted nicotinamide N-methyase